MYPIMYNISFSYFVFAAESRIPQLYRLIFMDKLFNFVIFVTDVLKAITTNLSQNVVEITNY